MIPFPPVSVVIDGLLIASSTPAYVQAGTVMAPMEPFALKLGSEVVRGPSGQVTIRRGSRWITLVPGEPAAATGGEIRTLPIAPSVRDGVVFIPLAAVARSLGMTVSYVARSRAAYVASARPAPLESLVPVTPRPDFVPAEAFTAEPVQQPRPVFTGIPRARRTPIEMGRTPP